MPLELWHTDILGGHGAALQRVRSGAEAVPIPRLQRNRHIHQHRESLSKLPIQEILLLELHDPENRRTTLLRGGAATVTLPGVRLTATLSGRENLRAGAHRSRHRRLHSFKRLKIPTVYAEAPRNLLDCAYLPNLDEMARQTPNKWQTPRKSQDSERSLSSTDESDLSNPHDSSNGLHFF